VGKCVSGCREVGGVENLFLFMLKGNVLKSNTEEITYPEKHHRPQFSFRGALSTCARILVSGEFDVAPSSHISQAADCDQSGFQQTNHRA